MKPASGSMVYWRFKSKGTQWYFGYCTFTNHYDLVRMGRWNGDITGGMVVSINDIEWKKYV